MVEVLARVAVEKAVVVERPAPHPVGVELGRASLLFPLQSA